MPLYNLKCRTCDREFDILASVSDKNEKRIHCPECESNELEALWKNAPRYLKGGIQSSKELVCANSETCGKACQHAV